jgi:hypothetical protein
MSTENPLDSSHFEQIMRGLEASRSAIAQAEMAIRAGIKAEAQLATAKEQEARLLKLKQVYFPNQ